MGVNKVVEKIKIYKQWNRYSCFLVSEEIFNNLPRNEFKEYIIGTEDYPSLTNSGFIYLSFEGIPVLFNDGVEKDNIVCIEKDLVKALTER